MPYANNQGVRIHYEVEGDGPLLVLLHGFGNTLEMWYDSGHVESLKNDYRLILIDARGHGASDKPHDPEAYKMELMVTDVVAVLDDLNISKAHFFGYSMGGQIGFGIAKYAPERFHSLIIGGAHPYGEDANEADQELQLFKKGLEAVTAASEEAFGPRMTAELRARFMANDVDALIAFISEVTRDRDWLLGFEDVLPTIRVPCLIFVGEADSYAFLGAKKCVKTIPNATFISLPGLNHTETRYRNDLMLPHIKKFLKTVSQV